MSTGKSIITQTNFASKKLLGKAHTSNLKTDVNESIPSNVSLPSTTVFGDPIPNDPGDAFYTVYSASVGENAAVERVYFDIVSISDTIYDADTPGGGGDENSETGPHGYYLKLPANYETTSSNPNRGTGSFTNGKRIYDSRGGLQLVPPLISNASPNKYFIKIYKGDPSDPANEITSGDTIDWQFDYYAGVVFIQDYFASKEPVTASAYLYVGDYLDDKINNISGSSIAVKDEGSDLTTAVSSFDFVGSGVTATTSGNDVTITIDGGGGSATAQGPTGSVQFHSASGEISGSSNLIFLDNQTLFLTGTLIVSGAIEANTFEIISTTVTEIDQSGSTAFGDTNDDTHHFTGSLSVFSSSTDLFAVDVENKTTKIKTGLTYNRVSVVSDYAVLKSDYYIGINTASPSAIITASLPNANTLNDGQTFVFKDEGGSSNTYNIVISASSGQTIDDQNKVILESPYSSLTIYSDGASKFFIT